MSAAGLLFRATRSVSGHFGRPLAWLFCASLAVLGIALQTMGAEPARPFIDALVSQGYHDTAIEYLDYLEKNSLAPESMRGALDYERSVILIAWATAPGDLSQQLGRLDEAVKLLERFLKDQPQHARREEARGRLSDILFSRAGLEMALATREVDEATKGKHRANAISFFEQAHAAYADRVVMSMNAYKAMREEPAETRDAERYKQLRDEIESAMFLSARTQYEWAMALRTPPDADEKKSDTVLKKAQQEFLDFSQSFRKHLRGVLAIYYAAKCHQQQGELDDALALFDELRHADPGQEALRELITNATTASMEIWMGEKKNDAAKAVELGETWAKELLEEELQSMYGIEFQWTLSQAIDLALKNAKGSEKELLAARRRKILNTIAQTPNTHQVAARKLVAEARTAKNPTDMADDALPTNLADAKLALKGAREELASTQLIVDLLEPKLADATGERHQEMETQLAQARKEIDQQLGRAQLLAQAALELAPPETSVEELAEIKHFLAVTAYEAQDYLVAAVLGEHIARYHPGSTYGRSMGKIALAAYQRLYLEAPEADRRFEQDQLMSVADQIAKSWPGEQESEDAALLLIQLHTQLGNMEQAQTLLDRFPKESSRRADAEMGIGVRQWRQYLIGKQQQREAAAGELEPGSEPPDDATLEQLKQRALAILERAVLARKDKPVDNTMVNGALTLSEIYIDTNQANKALSLLEDPQYGPKTLADKNSELMTGPGVADRTYRVSLRAYIATLPAATNKQAQLEKTTGVMQALDSRAGTTPEGRAQLAAIYKSLALDLRQQLSLAPPSTQQELAQGFDAFLENVLKNTHDFSLLFWIAETYSELASGFDTQGATLTPNAKKYFEKAATVYANILAMQQQGELDLQEQAVTALRIRSASTARHLGKYDEAFSVFEQLLKENNSLLNVQIEAAEALQSAGMKTANLDLLDQAINGRSLADDGKKNIIWGWGMLSKICQAQMSRSAENRERFGPTFYSARYNLVRCRYEQARLQSGADQKKYLDIVKRGIASLVGSYPDLGGPASYDKFDRLIKQVQKDLGEEIRGIAGLSN